MDRRYSSCFIISGRRGCVQPAFLGLGDDAVFIAIAEIDDQADGQPYDEADLRDCRQHDDQDTAEEDRQDRDQRYAGAAERADAVRRFFAEDDDRCRYDDEGCQRADVDHFSDDADRNEAARMDDTIATNKELRTGVLVVLLM